MKLQSVRISGFKSFADATTIPIPGKMNAIVGPNGCGKSNIVDAIRWVIGERSAKNLRGESMADVIFNGTFSRKPVGKASAELIFDNAKGHLGGEYAQFDEISIKREVERDGSSRYFINNVVARRRDILDLFLGTGLGPRSYSIIEQGMISKLIEAKPEELRSHIEEVAGISKYKERRRETENRMQRTRDNLDRLNDIREELTKQLRHLKRQSNAAKRYNEYQEQSQLLDAQLKAIQWSELQDKINVKHQSMGETQCKCDETIAMQRSLEASLEKSRSQEIELSDGHNEVQQAFYSLGASIARLEQQIKHHEQQVSTWQQELLTASSNQDELTQSIAKQHAMILDINNESKNLGPSLDSLTKDLSTAKNELQSADQAYSKWRSAWDKSQQDIANSTKKIEVSQNNINHFEHELARLIQKSDDLEAEKLSLQGVSNDEIIADLESKYNDQIVQRDSLQQAMDDISHSIATQRQAQADSQFEVSTESHTLQQLKARHTSLDALQQAALGDDSAHIAKWLDQQNLSNTKKLGQHLNVESGWELAVEWVLGQCMEAQCVDNTLDLASAANQLEKGSLLLLDQTCAAVASTSASAASMLASVSLLASKVKSDWPIEQWVNGIYAVSTLEEALSLREHLSIDESIITQEGAWLGANWLRVVKGSSAQDSVLVRQAEIDKLIGDISTSELKLKKLKDNEGEAKAKLVLLESQREEQHVKFKTLTDMQSQAHAALNAEKNKQQSMLQQQARITATLAEYAQRSQVVNDQIKDQQEGLVTLQDLLVTQQENKDSLQSNRDSIDTTLVNSRSLVQKHQSTLDQVESRSRHQAQQLELLQQTVSREEKQLAQVSEKHTNLKQQLSQTGSPIEDVRKQLEHQLDERMAIEAKLHTAKDQLQDCQQSLRQLDQSRQQLDKKYKIQQELLQNERMDEQALIVRQATIMEQLEILKKTPEHLLSEMPEDVNVASWESQLAVIVQRMERLGPINLAAIDEYETLSERDAYLAQQHADLTEATSILEGAISKIDKSTRSMFKDTFHAVNKTFSELFPTIFGGGKACLELTEADYLTTGVQVMAQPPGKRNATIHMLSGGEKALTAIALVFAMFKLTPAPFCILDEVDAPLDDVNVGRYCNLLKAMEGSIQFLVISHNKVTISMADYLLGVTMQEAGVSRLVSVDMDTAMEMAE